MTKIAELHGRRWIDMECDRCRTRYECLADETGRVSTTSLASDQTVREMAQVELRAAMKHAALRVPCPKCGAYANERVEAVQKIAGRVAGCLSCIVVFVVLFVVLALSVPKAPAWTLIIVAAVAWIASRFVAKVAMIRNDPNRDLEANLRIAQQGVARGVVRLEAAPSAGPSARAIEPDAV